LGLGKLKKFGFGFAKQYLRGRQRRGKCNKKEEAWNSSLRFSAVLNTLGVEETEFRAFYFTTVHGQL